MHPEDASKTLGFHRFLLEETLRVEAFRRAINSRVKPGDVVLDVGTGTGIFAFFACQAGARRVYAVEPGDVIEIARRLAEANGFADRIVFVKDVSFHVELPQKADALVTDTLGSLGVECGILVIVEDARARLLKEGAALVPEAVSVRLAPVEAPALHGREISFWGARFGLDFSSVRSHAANNHFYTRFRAEELLAPPAPVIDLALAHLAFPGGAGEVEVVVRRDGLMHGLAGMFSADLGGGETLTNVPPARNSNYSHAFLPLEDPVAVAEGDRLRLGLRCCRGMEWAWTVERTGGGPPFRRGHATILGFPLAEGALRRRASDFAPTLSRRGEAELHLLRSCDGATPLAGLERDLRERFPDCFRTPEQAALFVREAAGRWA